MPSRLRVFDSTVGTKILIGLTGLALFLYLVLHIAGNLLVFLGPTVFDDVAPEMFVGREEIFGPVVSVMRAPDLDAAITLTNRSRYGNTVSLFTQSGAAARTFRERIQVGMLGINLGAPAPMAFFPFGGWKNSFYGDLNAQGADAVDDDVGQDVHEPEARLASRIAKLVVGGQYHEDLHRMAP